MIFTIIGKIVTTKPVYVGKGNEGREWEKQEYVIENNDGERFAFYVFGKDNIERYGFTNGMRVAVSLELKQTEWNDRFITSLQCVNCLCNKGNQGHSSSISNESNVPANNNEQSTRRNDTRPSYDDTSDSRDGGSVNAKDLPF